jgi:23S rRNA pseudouridine1911/1915/1917 synthase
VALLRVEPGLAGRRVDAVVAAALPGASVHEARRLIAAGRVRVDGRRPRKGDRVAAGQVLEVDAEPAGAGPAVQPAPALAVAVAVLHADAWLVAVDKPAGVASHPLRAGELGTAANAIVARFPECALASPDPREGGLAHRLDRETSGVLLAARSREVWPRLREALGAEGCEKVYVAEVVGEPGDRGTEEAPIGRAGRRGGKVRLGAGRRPQPARTDWEILERRQGTALVRARLRAGRAHQVRAHLSGAGLPIVGDAAYGAPPAGEGERLHLHAASIAFVHPMTGASILIEAPLPGWAMMRTEPR